MNVLMEPMGVIRHVQMCREVLHAAVKVAIMLVMMEEYAEILMSASLELTTVTKHAPTQRETLSAAV